MMSKKTPFNYILFFILFLIQSLITFFYAWSIFDIKYVFIGDEYAMYEYARNIVIGTINPNIFSLNGVYETNPVLGSYYQAFFMYLFGTSIPIWKFSSIVIIFPLGLLFFYLIKKISTIPAALLGLCMLDFSFYLYNFFQIGYLNNLSLLTLVTIMFLLAYLDNTATKRNYIYLCLLGIVTGLSWYFYIGKLYVFLVSAYLVITYTFNMRYLKQFLYFLLPALFLIGIGFLVTNGPEIGLSKTVVQKEFSDNFQIIKNVIAPLYLAFYTPSQTHYLPIPAYTDILTAIFSALGMLFLGLSFFNPQYNIYPKYRSFLVLFILLIFAIGMTSPYSYPPATRGIHYVPFYILFAVYAVSIFLHATHKSKFAFITIYSSILCLIIFLNLREIRKPLPYNTTQHIFQFIKTAPSNRVLLLDNCNYNFHNIITLSEGYNLSKIVAVQHAFSEKSCNTQDYIISCSPITCASKKEMQFEESIAVYTIR